ncbi:FecR family protein [Pedobacter africanus]|uniref:FecR family protein n=1 Tax=Pedobacter africanus TaxID=151894 RepID=A0A1W1ZW17_9SPHI|nr:FecR family protein [Pedobacter africanus]SMC52649.1 FecR family protein [Pedobacter africanus]
MTKEQFIVLFEKCASGYCTAEELAQLENYQDDFELTVKEWSAEMGSSDEVRQQILEKLRSQISAEGEKRRSNFRYWVAAASVLIFLAAGTWFWVNTKDEHQIVRSDSGATIIKPGRNRAILTLADGKKLDLDDAATGIISRQGASILSKTADGKLAYGTNTDRSDKNAVAYNTIETPRGGQYQLTLADGTEVWMNAGSSLKYPTSFRGKERKVELTGEAYFEVAKNKEKPFSVVLNGMKVEVLGTHFNVMAYNDENVIETTLLEGSVKLTKDGSSTMLIPNQQGVLNNGASNFRVRAVNTENVIAWKNGFFKFDDENIETIMRKVARWYDVDVTYKGNLKPQNFGGNVPRFKDISQLLTTLELTGTVHFKIDGRRITVMP